MPNTSDVIANIAADMKDAGYTVYEYQRTPGVRTTWVIIESDNGNAVTVTVDSFRGIEVAYPVKPSIEYGSGLLVWGEGHYALGMGTWQDAVRVALESDTWVTSFANPGHPLKNDGMAHFAWAKDKLVTL